MLRVKSAAIGMDMGTTISVVSVLKNGRPECIPNNSGVKLNPSVVSFSNAGEILVGKEALKRKFKNLKNTLDSAKRFIGLNQSTVLDDLAKPMPFRLTAQPDSKLFRYSKFLCNHFNLISFNITGFYFYNICFNCKEYKCRPEQVAALVMAHLKAISHRIV